VTLRRATGEAAFAGDIVRPDTLHVAICRSPVAHGRVVGVDVADAGSLPGVVAVLTPDDAGGLLDPILRFVGDRAGLAVAEDPELARKAADMVRLEVEPLAATLDPEAALDDPDEVAARIEFEIGDVDRAFAEADHVVEGTWMIAFAPRVPLEPPVALTWLDEDRRLVVRTSAESPFRVRSVLAGRLGIPAARIRVVRPLVAGGAGGRSDVPIEDLCALVTLRTGRPARLALTAEEELTTAPGRPPQRIGVRLALRGGRISGLAVRLLIDVGQGTAGAEDLLRSAGRQALAVYGAPDLRFAGAAVRTHRPPTSASRGADNEAAFALECAIEEAAAAIDADPVAFRRQNLRRPRPGGPAALAELDEPDAADDARSLETLLDAATEGDAWGRPVQKGPTRHPVRKARGMGLARRSPGVAGGTGAAASLRLLEDGSFTLTTVPSSAGGADENAFAAAAAALLGVPARRVVTAAVDTDSAPFEAGVLAPAFFAAGRAVEEAARLTHAKIRESGARLLGVEPTAVEIASGEVRAPGGEAVSFAAIGTVALNAGQPLVVTAAPSAASAPPADAVVIADVEVDTETGVVSVVALNATLTGGPFDDPRPAEGQVEGALALALEQALAAGVTFDSAGVPRARPLRSWPLVAATDIPQLRVTFVPAGEASTRFGAVALGETAGRAALAAIACAVSRATGGRVRSLPLDPGTVLDLPDPD
jgi:putative selenate reductase molybdopterin-binding subunit